MTRASSLILIACIVAAGVALAVFWNPGGQLQLDPDSPGPPVWSEDSPIEGEPVSSRDDAEGRVEHELGSGFDPEDSGLWWEDEAVYAIYYEAFERRMRSKPGPISQKSALAKLEELESKIDEGQHPWLTRVDWAEFGSFSNGREISHIVMTAGQMIPFGDRYFELKGVESGEEERRNIRARIDMNPFGYFPSGVLSGLLDRRVALSESQHEEIQRIYWRHLKDRAKAQKDFMQARRASIEAILEIGLRVGDAIPEDSDFLPAPLMGALSEVRNSRDAYLEALTGFAASEEL